MNFEQALPALKAGNKIRRKFWPSIYPGFDMYLKTHKYETQETYIYIWSNTSIKDGFIDIKAKDGDFNAVEWFSAQQDILTNDWEIIN